MGVKLAQVLSAGNKIFWPEPYKNLSTPLFMLGRMGTNITRDIAGIAIRVFRYSRSSLSPPVLTASSGTKRWDISGFLLVQDRGLLMKPRQLGRLIQRTLGPDTAPEGKGNDAANSDVLLYPGPDHTGGFPPGAMFINMFTMRVTSVGPAAPAKRNPGTDSQFA